MTELAIIPTSWHLEENARCLGLFRISQIAVALALAFDFALAFGAMRGGGSTLEVKSQCRTFNAKFAMSLPHRGSAQRASSYV